MTPPRPMRALVVTELRALLPIWLVAALGVLVGVASGAGAAWISGMLYMSVPYEVSRLIANGLELAGGLSFVIGCVALGAWSIGHEYVHRTLPVLLAQPVSRTSLFGAKAIALLVTLSGLAFLAVPLWADAGSLQAAGQRLPASVFLLLAPVLGLCVAPWLTALARSPLGGATITLSVPAVLWLAGEIVRARRYGITVVPEDYTLGGTLLWSGSLAVSLVALVAGPLQLSRLQALGVSRQVQLPSVGGVRARASVAGGRRRHPVVALLAKEVRLQQVTLLLPLLYTLAWAAIVMAGVGDYVLGSTFFGMTTIYSLVTAVMLGAVASAEERAHGTHASQLLQPVAYWQQWLVKVFALLALTALLTMALPEILERVYALSDQATVSRTQAWVLVVSALAGLYVSSVTSSGLRAMLLSTALVPAGAMLYSVARGAFGAWAYAAIPPEYVGSWRPPLLTLSDLRFLQSADDVVGRLVWWGIVLLMLWLAARNHRSSEGMRGRWMRQAWLPLSIVVGAATVGGTWSMLWWYLASH